MVRTLAAGLLYVEKRIRQLSKELGRRVDCLEWLRPTDEQMSGVVSLKLWRGGEFRIIEFQGEEFVAVEGDPEVQRRLGGRIAQSLKRFRHDRCIP